jgi:hypothetical protein
VYQPNICAPTSLSTATPHLRSKETQNTLFFKKLVKKYLLKEFTKISALIKTFITNLLSTVLLKQNLVLPPAKDIFFETWQEMDNIHVNREKYIKVHKSRMDNYLFRISGRFNTRTHQTYTQTRHYFECMIQRGQNDLYDTFKKPLVIDRPKCLRQPH